MSVDNKKITLQDSITQQDYETSINDTENKNPNSVWRNKLNLENFVVICTDEPQSMQCRIKFGFKSPDTPNTTNPGQVSGQELFVDIFRAQVIMAKTKAELYQLFMQKSNSEVIS